MSDNKADRKWCPSCKSWLSLDSFWNHKSKPDGKRTFCKSCEGTKKKIWKSSLRHDKQKVERLWEHQNRLCAICHEPIALKDVRLDHDHLTGLIRGAVHDICNIGLGFFRDSPERLANAIEYLLHHELPDEFANWKYRF